MKRLALRCLFPLAAALAAACAMAQPAQGNGCGTGWSAYLVPDSISLAGCTFVNACNTHDVCYGRCEKPVIEELDQICLYRKCRSKGALFGKEACEQEPYLASELAARERKTSCDRVFYTDLRQLNQGKPICEAFSALYFKAVAAFGQSAFIGVAPPGAKEGELPFTPGSRKAIKDFFDQADEAQLRQLIEQLDRPSPARPPLDPSRPLMYVPGQGLRNDG